MYLQLLYGTALLYCFACYALSLYWIQHPDEECGEQSLQLAEFLDRQPIRSNIILALVIVFCSPFLMPYVVYLGVQEYRRESKLRTHRLRNHTDYSFVWLNPSKLPEDVREYFDDMESQLLELGFFAQGSYIMKVSYPDYFGRLYLSSDGVSVCSTCELEGGRFFSFSTLFESGRVLESAPMENPDQWQHFVDNKRFTGNFPSDATLAETYASHQEKIREISAEAGDRPLEFEADDVCDVLSYEGRVFSREKYTLGKYDSEPPEPVLPEGKPVEAEALSCAVYSD